MERNDTLMRTWKWNSILTPHWKVRGSSSRFQNACNLGGSLEYALFDDCHYKLLEAYQPSKEVSRLNLSRAPTLWFQETSGVYSVDSEIPGHLAEKPTWEIPVKRTYNEMPGQLPRSHDSLREFGFHVKMFIWHALNPQLTRTPEFHPQLFTY